MMQQQAYACFYLKCQHLTTGDIQTYVFQKQADLLAFAQAAAEYKWAILHTEIKFFELRKWYAHLTGSQRETLLHFSPEDYEQAIDGKTFLIHFQNQHHHDEY